jgi:hypothetical protein
MILGDDMRKQKLEIVRKKLDELFLEHTAKRNWRITKGMLESIVQILNESNCNPTPIQQKAILDLIQREFN